ncbi:FAD-dependent oxidoreductase [Lactobacillus delbrueckii]|uniref:FAD-dependent oxidoreductase n=1 Tax=Lactobacillus delbrueckii TaxID=1584 RepID=UPI0035CF9B23
MKKYDYIIIGSGPAANHLLFKLARTDRTALVIENNLWGGTCPNTGCQPKIFLEGAVRPVLNTYYLTGKGVKAAAQHRKRPGGYCFWQRGDHWSAYSCGSWRGI